MWLDEDFQAALEWQEYKDSLCPGCGRDRVETFDRDNDDRYTVERIVCHACAARDRKAWNDSQAREPGSPPPAGIYYSTRHDDDL